MMMMMMMWNDLRSRGTVMVVHSISWWVARFPGGFVGKVFSMPCPPLPHAWQSFVSGVLKRASD